MVLILVRLSLYHICLLLNKKLVLEKNSAILVFDDYLLF